METSTADGWSLVDRGGLRLARCAVLEAVPGVAHGFSTRQGPGGEDFDLGRATRQDAAAGERQRALVAACGLAGRSPVALEQVHGNDIHGLASLEPGIPSPGDAIIALRGERDAGAASVRYADCLPILLADRAGGAIGAVHAGWRGTAAGIASRAVRALVARGIRAADLVAGLGPAIGPCCYEVGDDVLEAVARSSGASVRQVSRELSGGTRALDLPEANRLQLVAAGLAPESVYRAPWCTCCRQDLFFSHRRQGSPAGRMQACIGWMPDRPLP